MGIAASVDYRGDHYDDQPSSYLLNSDDENDGGNAAIAPIGFTPTSSPEQLPDLLQKTNSLPDQAHKDKENQPTEEIASIEHPLPNVGDLEIFALQ